MSASSAFAYPLNKHEWRHGPIGYATYESFREWLRDEFSFRCVFCLRREQWDVGIGAFHIDHYVPQSLAPDRTLSYENLLYVCTACNLKKGDLAVPDPSILALGNCVHVLSNGTIEALNSDGELLIEQLRLDDEDCTRYRRMILEMLGKLEAANREMFVELMRFPSDLPDLSRLKPPGGNSRPDGIASSWFAKRERGELTEVY